MKAYEYSMIGLSLDIIGAFLVSVEAIKLENVRRFRDALAKLETYTQSPKIYFVNDKPHARREKPAPATRYLGLFMGLHNVAGLLLFMAVNRACGGKLSYFFMKAGIWVLDRPWYVVVLFSLAFVVFGIVWGLWMLGELVHMTITKIFNITIGGLNFVDARTPDGSVGMIGFVLLFFGFLFQMLGTYFGHPQ